MKTWLEEHIEKISIRRGVAGLLFLFFSLGWFGYGVMRSHREVTLDRVSYVLYGTFLVVAPAFFAIVLLYSWRYVKNPSSHKVMKRAIGWGSIFDVSEAVERDCRSPILKNRAWSIGEQYLVNTTFLTFDVFRTTDLIWAYKSVTKHSFNFVPTGKTYSAVLVFTDGRVEIQGGHGQMQVDNILIWTSQRAPWAVFGYSEEIANAFAKDPEGFRQTIATMKATVTYNR